MNYTDSTDLSLINESVKGNKFALKNLIIRHQIYIFNLALKLTKSTEDAEDLTQEVLIKAISSLSNFKHKSKFRTWLYRITVNHFLNSKKKNTELNVVDFESYFNAIDQIPDKELTDFEKTEYSETIEEIRINCTAGMLLCLDREQRIIYVLGEMFRIDHNLGAEIMGISKGNFRIRLMRAREDLYNWMNKRCGLVNKENPCRCSKKTKVLIEKGIVNPNKLIFNHGYKKKVYDLSEKKAVQITDTVDDLYVQIFQSHPFQESLNASKIVDEIFNNDVINLVFNHNSQS
ncbi:RNA polymerase sigma factor [Aestuariivivens sediminis]|uniref:RNA polymerase sigma factor n=1 Tax=Aestuariivivens sediminis TaxID=2913557 RepID=UPI001F589F26|nr:RNA polymerase sigma factor [Aestuariivivens sediminis]